MNKEAQEKIANIIRRNCAGDWTGAVVGAGDVAEVILDELEELGYRKLPKDRLGLREKIRQIEKERATYPIAHPIEEYLDQILALIPDIPKDKPPLLGGDELNKARKKYEAKFHFELLREQIPPIIYARAQREADIKWYEELRFNG